MKLWQVYCKYSDRWTTMPSMNAAVFWFVAGYMVRLVEIGEEDTAGSINKLPTSRLIG